MSFVRLVAVVVALFTATAVMGAETIKGPITAQVIRVVDGDTLEVEIQIWFDLNLTTSVRVLGVDTPETRGKCPAEVEAAKNASMFTFKAAPPGSLVRLHDVKPDKFAGRIDARVELTDGKWLAQTLIEAGLARPYEGDKRQSWCQ